MSTVFPLVAVARTWRSTACAAERDVRSGSSKSNRLEKIMKEELNRMRINSKRIIALKTEDIMCSIDHDNFLMVVSNYFHTVYAIMTQFSIIY